jgi:hypothetical protein
MDDLDVAEELLGLSTKAAQAQRKDHAEAVHSQRRFRRDLIKSLSRDKIPFDISVEVMECSTLEQAAYAVRGAKDSAEGQKRCGRLLGRLSWIPLPRNAITVLNVISSTSSSSGSPVKGGGLRKMLEIRSKNVCEALVQRLDHKLTSILKSSDQVRY